jgi:hypothetical protein
MSNQEFPTPSRSPLLDGPDPFLPVKLEEAVGDHAGRVLERQLGLLDQVVLLDGLTPTTRTLLRRF